MLNQITIQGRMAKDAEDKMLNSGKVMTTFCVAVQRNYKNNEGKYDADFIDCVAYGKTGEFIGKYFHKGDFILLSGELQIRTYDDKNGVKHKVSVVNTANAYFVSNGTAKKENPAAAPAPVANASDDSGDFPFQI